MRNSLLILAFFVFPLCYSYAEGTKQIQPTAASHAKVQIMPNWTEFAWYDRFGVSGNPEFRLNIHVSNIGEVIYYGLGDPLTANDQVRNDMSYRIKDPLGNVVVGPFPIPLAGPGHISTYAQAVAGPSAIAGPGGYQELSYVPLMTGDYFIEFDFLLTWNNEHKQCKFTYFDVTVADAANNPIDGRVWSKAWQFSCDDQGNTFDAKMYVYSNEGIVSSVLFNGMDPFEFNLVCNEYGVTNTGNFLIDRLSQTGLFMLPQFKVFLNDPDSLAYPTGQLGTLIPPVVATPDCHGNVDFTVNVTQPGDVEILLDINPLPGIQAEDTIIAADVVAGINHITWNGIDGNGNPVTYGTIINATITYYNGLTNLPVWDVDLNPNGYQVDLVRPTGHPLEVYWDDHLVGGSVNLTGCDYHVTGGCHPFLNGTGKTINTWWRTVNPVTLPLTFTYLTTPGLIKPINGPTTICPNSGGNIYWIHKEPNSTGYIWNYSGTDYTLTNINDTTISLDLGMAATPGILSVQGFNVFCGTGPATIFAISLYPVPTLSNNPLTKQQCNNLPTNITLTSTVPGTLFTWTASGSSANVTGYANNLVPSTFLNQVLINSGNSPEFVTYSITPQANGCFGPVYTYTVTVYPTPLLLTTPLSKQQCNNLPTGIVLSSNVGGATFSWTCTPSSGMITGYSAGAGNFINQTLVNSGFVPESVIYRITPSAFGCSGATYNFVVTVYPTPDLSNAPLSRQQCNNLPTNIVLTSNVSGTTFNWTCTPSSPMISGFGPGSGTILNQTLANTGYNTEWVMYHITPVANGCSGNVYNYLVTVYPTPDLTTSPLNKQQCNNVNTGISLTSNVFGTTFSWTCTPSSGSISGFSAGMGVNINQTLVNSGFTTGTVTYHILPIANGCTGIVYDYTVTVFPTPDVSNSPLSKQICNNTATGIILTSDVSGTSFSWTCTPSTPGVVTGFFPASGSWLNQTLSNSGFNTEWVTYHITPSANGCPGPVTDFPVTVFPVANVLLNPSYQAICSNTITAVNISSNVAGATFAWTITPVAGHISGFFPGTGNSINQKLLLSGYIRDSILYTVTASANGCPGTQNQVYIRVNPISLTTFTMCNDPITTVNSVPIVLNGGIPTGGVYSGPGVAAGLFNPAISGPGNHTITYTYNNIYGCATSATQVLSVLAAVPFACGNTLTDVRDTKQYPTIQIGGQCWMAANLDYGTDISSGISQRDNCIVEKYCLRGTVLNCAKFGGFYQWDEMMHYSKTNGNQGICPPAWHVPTEAEWLTLFNQFAPLNLSVAGAALKSTGYTGFDALMNGFNNMNRVWSHDTFATMFWSSTPIGQYKAWAHGMNTPDAGVSSYPGFRNNAFQLRCVQD